jgi:hypothetical protein
VCPGKCELAENPQFRWRGGADVIDCHAALVEEERERDVRDKGTVSGHRVGYM